MSVTHVAKSFGNILKIALKKIPLQAEFFAFLWYHLSMLGILDRKKLFNRLSLLIIFIFIVNFLAVKFYWYSSIWWLDILTHFLGGFWLSLSVSWFFSGKSTQLSIIKTLIIVLIIGLLWEVFEIVVNETISKNNFDLSDTLADLFFDLSGGVVALFYMSKRLILKEEVK